MLLTVENDIVIEAASGSGLSKGKKQTILVLLCNYSRRVYVMKGIDVAKWNGTIKWDKVKTAGISFAILKVINKQCQEEDPFQKNYVGATTQGITVGCYNYSYATNVEKARQDVGKVLQVLNGRKMPCRVWLDVEDKCQ